MLNKSKPNADQLFVELEVSSCSVIAVYNMLDIVINLIKTLEYSCFSIIV